MPNRRERKATSLFREGERGRQAIDPEVTGYRCPLCWTLFEEDAVRNGLLTIEHVPQQRWGAKAQVLTCRDCNNTFGYKYQHVSGKLKDLAELRGEGPTMKHRARAVIDGRSFNARVHRDTHGRLWIQGSIKNNPPEVSKHWLKMGGAPIDPETTKIYLPGEIDDAVVHRVLLRDALLLAFNWLGFPYLATEPAQDVTRLLAEDRQLPEGVVWEIPNLPISVDPGAGEFLWMQSPDELASLFVSIDVPSWGRRYVVLPFFPYHWLSYGELCKALMVANKDNTGLEMIFAKATVAEDAKYSTALLEVPTSSYELELRPQKREPDPENER